MQWAVLATWKMSLNGCDKAASLLKMGDYAHRAVLNGIHDVEDNPSFHSVGYGGRPDINGHVVLDGGFMDGNTLHFGAVGSIEGYRSPVSIAYSLLKYDANNFLVGHGAEQYAESQGFAKRNNVTEESTKIYEQGMKERKQKLKAYDGHDTVCFLAKDIRKTIVAATSTSGLFLKEAGRVGDSSLPGNGYYADSDIGAAAATGMGEEIMKGALSYAAVARMAEGDSAQEAADHVVNHLDQLLKKRNGYAQAMSLIVMDKEGSYGIGTNVPFTFTYASENTRTTLFEAVPDAEHTIIREVKEI